MHFQVAIKLNFALLQEASGSAWGRPSLWFKGNCSVFTWLMVSILESVLNPVPSCSGGWEVGMGVGTNTEHSV